MFNVPLGIQSWIKDGSRLVLHQAVRKVDRVLGIRKAVRGLAKRRCSPVWPICFISMVLTIVISGVRAPWVSYNSINLCRPS